MDRNRLIFATATFATLGTMLISLGYVSAGAAWVVLSLYCLFKLGMLPPLYQRSMIGWILLSPMHRIKVAARRTSWALELRIRKRFGGNRWIEGVDHDDMTPSMRRKEEQRLEREAETDLLFMD
ncbi:hypothetical protein PCC82_11355 [Agrobacterium deltaense]